MSKSNLSGVALCNCDSSRRVPSFGGWSGGFDNWSCETLQQFGGVQHVAFNGGFFRVKFLFSRYTARIVVWRLLPKETCRILAAKIFIQSGSRLAVDLLQLICKRQLARYGCVVVVVAEKSWHQKESGKIKHLCLYALGTQALQKKHWKNPFWGLKPGC